MGNLIMFFDTITIRMDTGIDIKDITRELSHVVSRSGIADGVVNTTAIGSTGSLTTIEYEPGVVNDLKRAINEIAPPEQEYEHEKAWHDGNGHSHVQAAILGPSLSVPIRKGRIRLGNWQQVVLINHDNHARERSVEVTVMGLR